MTSRIIPLLALALALAACSRSDPPVAPPQVYVTPPRPPVPPQAPLPVLAADPSLFALSAPVNGLAARVENADSDDRDRYSIFLRLENIGPVPLTIPAVNRRGPWPFTLQARQKGTWVDVPWKTHFIDGTADLSGAIGSVPPSVRLERGQSALIELGGSFTEELALADDIRVTLQVSNAPGTWNGTLQTPARPWHLSDAAIKANARTLDMPTLFPQFPTSGRIQSPNGSPVESIYTGLYDAYYPLMQQLRLYKEDQVRSEMDKRTVADIDVPYRLLPAVQAALRGSKTAQDLIESCRHESDYEILSNTFSAMESAAFDDSHPQWVLQAMTESILDRRPVTNNHFHVSSMSVADLAEDFFDFTRRLGQLHYQPAIPALLQVMSKRSSAADAIGEIGDPAAIPELLRALQTGNSPSVDIARALAKLRAHEALPILLQHASSSVESLEDLGDPSAVPALKNIHTLKARLAVITLIDPDPTMAYIAVMEDRSLGEFDRREALYRLGYHPDPRAIPALIRAIKTEPSGAVVNNAILIIGDYYRYPEAVTGLIDCLDADFHRSPDWIRAYTPEMFRDHIAQVLRQITGQSLGSDKTQWQSWWRSVGQQLH